MAGSYRQDRYNESMIVLSDDLRQAIQKVATCPLESHENTTNSHDLLEMDAPYRFLYHHREPLRAYSQSAAAQLGTRIGDVLKYVDDNYAREYAEAAELISRGVITPSHLEKLYHPNQILVDGMDIRLENRGIYVLATWPKMRHDFLDMSFWCWEFDGYRCHRSKQTVGIPVPVEDETEPFAIDKLLLYPASFLSEESIELFRKRGKAFWSLRLPNFVYYDDTGNGTQADYAKPGRYMIDFEMHSRLHSKHIHVGARNMRNKQLDPWRLTLSPRDEPEEDEFLMMPTKIAGYDFLEKEWISLSVSNIKPIKWNKQPYEDFVLSPATKHLVKALVTVRANKIKKKEEHAGFDIISGKGNGLIMLFHGSPGTGKTLTAEVWFLS